jgi:hypothetical protein
MIQAFWWDDRTFNQSSTFLHISPTWMPGGQSETWSTCRSTDTGWSRRNTVSSHFRLSYGVAEWLRFDPRTEPLGCSWDCLTIGWVSKSSCSSVILALWNSHFHWILTLYPARAICSIMAIVCSYRSARVSPVIVGRYSNVLHRHPCQKKRELINDSDFDTITVCTVELQFGHSVFTTVSRVQYSATAWLFHVQEPHECLFAVILVAAVTARGYQSYRSRLQEVFFRKTLLQALAIVNGTRKTSIFPISMKSRRNV